MFARELFGDRLSTRWCGEGLHDLEVGLVAEELHRAIAHQEQGSVPTGRATEATHIKSLSGNGGVDVIGNTTLIRGDH